MRAQLTRLVWTTNVDPLVADACAKVYDATGPLTTVALDGPPTWQRSASVRGGGPSRSNCTGTFAPGS